MELEQKRRSFKAVSLMETQCGSIRGHHAEGHFGARLFAGAVEDLLQETRSETAIAYVRLHDEFIDQARVGCVVQAWAEGEAEETEHRSVAMGEQEVAAGPAPLAGDKGGRDGSVFAQLGCLRRHQSGDRRRIRDLGQPHRHGTRG